jgi:hypothetical protein
MNFHVTKKNKTGARREWHFYTDWDYACFEGKNAHNRLVFCRFHEFDKNGRPTKTYDITSNQMDCSWDVAKPSQEILDKAWEKLCATWHVVILGEDDGRPVPDEEPITRTRKRRRKKRES